MTRAFTYIDRSIAIVGNRWIERHWSPFVGATVALVDRADGFDWINNTCGELGLDLDGRFLHPVDLGEAVWTEENSPLGATLTCMRERPDLDVCVMTLAYHDMPAMLRTIRLLNKSGAPMHLRRIVMDSVAVARKTFRALIHGFREAHPAIVHDTDERAVALQLKHRGLIIGHEAPARYELCAPDPANCAVCGNATIVLEPGKWMELPACFLIPYRGPVADASRTRLADFLVHRREIENEANADAT